MKTGAKIASVVIVIVLALLIFARPNTGTSSAQTVYCRDDQGVLSEKTTDYITERNHNLEANCSGAQICVVVEDTIGTDPIGDYAAGVFKKLSVGGEDSNGVLILVLTGDLDYIILPGDGLSKLLTPFVLTEINRSSIEPYFTDRDYDTAVREAFRRLNTLICGQYGADPDGFVSGSSEHGGVGRPDGFSFSLPKFNCDSCSCVGALAFAACIGSELFSSIGGK